MKVSTRIVALAARASPGGRLLALLLALFVAAGVVILVGAALPSEAQTASTTYTVKDLGTSPGGFESFALGINDSGQVVGWATTSSGDQHAFLYSNARMQDLGTLGGTYSYAYGGINNAGQVVGFSETSSGEDHAFLYSNAQMQDLNSLIPAGSGWILREAHGINTSGQIVGYGVINGQTRAFLATPDTALLDTTPPTVTSTIPTGTTPVDPTINVRAFFSEDMQRDSVNGAFKLFKKGSTIPLAADVFYDAATDKATLEPENNLRRGVTYKAVVSTQAKDLAGNRLDQDPSMDGPQQMKWFFTVRR